MHFHTAPCQLDVEPAPAVANAANVASNKIANNAAANLAATLAIVALSGRESSCPRAYTFVPARQTHGDCRNLLPDPIYGGRMSNSSSQLTPKPEPNEKLIKIFDTEQENEAIVVQGLLESAGIESDLKSLDAVQDTFPGVGGTVLLVREQDASDARKIIEAYRKLPPLDDETADVAG
jgi:hypothetical protein